MASFTTTATIIDSGPPDYATRLRRARLGLLVALTPVLMLFVSFSSAYVVRQGLPTLDPRTNQLVRDWIPVTLPKLLLINTGVLILSSVFMELARRQIKGLATLSSATTAPGVSAGEQSRIPWLSMTLVLGLAFLLGQWTAWRQLAANGFYVATTPSSSFVYLLTGTHAIHLMGGILALLVAGIASLLRRSVATRSIVVDVTAWYWHFMAGLWIYILCLLEFAS
ncbi:MAG: heme-copper oxidase subunit III [Acidobacteria bacterium]|nr:MAG: heme-copper oxidase subunit III [Acidobacteriota bacterium]